MKKIVLAYSGGLDTSIILRWLQENYNAEIIAYTSDIGQVLDKKKIVKNAKRLGVKKIIIEVISKIYIFIQPFVILLGSSNNLLEANSTLNQISLSLTFQLRKTDKVVPISRTHNSLALISGKE